ncbi:MAG: mannose-1-phosphate guanylyltransferase [Ignavibacteria bacterium]
MKDKILFLELKTGFEDNGPAWIGKVKFSKTGLTVYFNNKGFIKARGIKGNYIDIESGEEYWISGIKKNGNDPHWAGTVKIQIDRKVVNDYLKITGKTDLDFKKFELTDISDSFPIERINNLQNRKIE